MEKGPYRHYWGLKLIYTCFFRWNGTDRQQLETFGLKIHFRSERIAAILWRTTGGNPQPNGTKIHPSFDCVPFHTKTHDKFLYHCERML
uniref:Uncharacterized protein n=1 Tax=Romanomermis culicivorax TaxID=13658 RepID=A0A915IMR8_ROMCU